LQVVTGGQYDVDMKVQGPNDEVLYQDVRKQYDSFNFKTKTAGTYKVRVDLLI
jgi:protein ERP2